MAVHAQHPSKSFLFNRDEEEFIIDEMDNSNRPHHLHQHQHQQQQSLFFSNNLSNGFQQNMTRKRGRDSSSSSSPNAAMFQMMPHHNQFVSTGLQLSFQDKNQFNLSSVINQQNFELEQCLNAQGEKLRRTLAERTKDHYRALLIAAEESASKQVREKEMEINRAGKKTAELETRLARIRNEALTWQARAVAEQEKATALQVQIQQAQLVSARRASDRAEPEAEDCESVFEDPNRVERKAPDRMCRVCGVSEVSTVMVPCRHLCMCDVCDATFGNMEGTVCCPVCNVVRTGSIQVFLN